ncbi:hypothetical protein C9374_012679 [Naegleria lovaniensis]|uniref:Uncharacterized protein n=1 Tax=Naegleria lovaniensis TaxID=51637 RepID=A0AA88H3K0_NAELO|nr:uncharacterized protein C9374_012679 [Naegleria lovaniensis]KAG2392427.1 hypothetical protein C9374_012679 [Naegleria lovaniensis]
MPSQDHADSVHLILEDLQNDQLHLHEGIVPSSQERTNLAFTTEELQAFLTKRLRDQKRIPFSYQFELLEIIDCKDRKIRNVEQEEEEADSDSDFDDFLDDEEEDDEENDSISEEDYQLFCPSDVKISYACKCVLVSDDNIGRILVLDLQSKQYLDTIDLPFKVAFMFIEENYDGLKRDALILSGGDHCVYKYDLEKLLRHPNCEYIWRAGFPNSKDVFNLPRGLAMYTYCLPPGQCAPLRRDQIYVCDYKHNEIKILDANHGDLLDSISLSFSYPYGIDITKDGHLVVCETVGEVIDILSHDEDQTWKLEKDIGESGTEALQFRFPSSVIVDKESQYLIVCDTRNSRLQILSQEGYFLKSVGDDYQQQTGQQASDFGRPVAVCLNERNGELLVCDIAHSKIRVYR